MLYLIYVQDRNKDTGRVTLNKNELDILRVGLATGRYSAVEVRVKKTLEVVVNLPAYCCSKLDLKRSNSKQDWQFVDLTEAYSFMKENSI